MPRHRRATGAPAASPADQADHGTGRRWPAAGRGANHRAHILFPDRTGVYPAGTQAVPALRMTLTYSVANGQSCSLDSFPEQLHNPRTDHATFANLMPDSLMSAVVDCINRGRHC